MNNGQRGWLRAIYGSMFGGKSRTLITFGKHAIEGHKHVLAFNHEKDVRYNGNGDITTHDGERFPATAVKNALEIYNHLKGYVKEHGIKDLNDIEMLVNEVQFFDHHLVDFCEEYKRFMHINLAFLDRDYMGRPFRFPDSHVTVSELIALADEKIPRKGRCMNVDLEHGILKRCGKPAGNTQLLDPNGDPITSELKKEEKKDEEKGTHIHVGGGKEEESKKGPAPYFEVRCDDCFVRPKGKSLYSLKDLVYVP